ncbi:MAG: GNAT family N-acetyltransferase [Dongiaceae bacterium]
MLIRPAEVGDLPALSELARKTYSESFGHSFTPSDLAFILNNEISYESLREAMAEDIILVAMIAEGLVGFVQFGTASPTTPALAPSDREIRRIYVKSDCQNRGIGRRLMAAALDHPSLRLAERIYIDVWERNPGAKRLYERFDFKVVGARELAVESGARADLDLIMVRHARLPAPQ